jgi:hypothetical protein
MSDQALAPMAARGGRPASGEPLLDRAFRILTAFSPEHRSLSLTALSLRADLPKASALRIIRKLVEWGALERASTGEYAIGLRLVEVAALAPGGQRLRAVVSGSAATGDPDLAPTDDPDLAESGDPDLAPTEDPDRAAADPDLAATRTEA